MSIERKYASYLLKYKYTDYRTGILAFLYHTERGTTVLAVGREDFVAQGDDTRDAGGGRGRFRF